LRTIRASGASTSPPPFRNEIVRVIASWLPAPVSRADLRVPAFVIPSVGIALLAPLTIHMLLLFGINDVEWFDDWCAMSLPTVGLAHLVFAMLVGLRARALVTDRPPIAVRTIFTLTVVASCVPYGMFILPPFLVAATGIPIVPLLFTMERIAKADREPALPTATVVT
jgi:hypothetical protein